MAITHNGSPPRINVECSSSPHSRSIACHSYLEAIPPDSALCLRRFCHVTHVFIHGPSDSLVFGGSHLKIESTQGCTTVLESKVRNLCARVQSAYAELSLLLGALFLPGRVRSRTEQARWCKYFCASKPPRVCTLLTKASSRRCA